MKDNYSKAYKEVLEILNFVPEESVNKIPKTIIETFKINMDESYNFQVDIDKSFEEQQLLEETKAILANIFRDYWATPYQKQKIILQEMYDRQKDEAYKKEKYNPDDIFKKSLNNIEKPQKLNNNLQIEAKKDNFFIQLIKYIKNIFKL